VFQSTTCWRGNISSLILENCWRKRETNRKPMPSTCEFPWATCQCTFYEIHDDKVIRVHHLLRHTPQGICNICWTVSPAKEKFEDMIQHIFWLLQSKYKANKLKERRLLKQRNGTREKKTNSCKQLQWLNTSYIIKMWIWLRVIIYKREKHHDVTTPMTILIRHTISERPTSHRDKSLQKMSDSSLTCQEACQHGYMEGMVYNSAACFP